MLLSPCIQENVGLQSGHVCSKLDLCPSHGQFQRASSCLLKRQGKVLRSSLSLPHQVQALALRMLRTPADFTAVKSAQGTREQEDPFFCGSNFIK